MSRKIPQNPLEHGYTPRFAGIHLSGPNAPKSALVVLSGGDQHLPLKIGKVYEKIGSFGRLFSDERLVSIVKQESPLREIFVDCPLSVPPCVECIRPTCPGVLACDDLGVAYMLSLGEKSRRHRRARPVNPQSQRLWDIYRDLDRTDKGLARMESSYSSNMAPLVIRARTLQRRLHDFAPDIVLKETSVAGTLELVAPVLGLPLEIGSHYRHFDRGPTSRDAVLQAVVAAGWLAPVGDEDYEVLTSSLEAFQAFIASWVAALHAVKLTTRPPDDYLDEGGWVHLPELSAAATHSRPTW